MIKTETIVINGNEYVRTYSTIGKNVVRDGGINYGRRNY